MPEVNFIQIDREMSGADLESFDPDYYFADQDQDEWEEDYEI